MTKYLLGRLLRGIISIILVVAVVMILLYTLIDKNNIFLGNGIYQKKQKNEREVYKYSCWEDYGYLDFVPYSDYLIELCKNGEISLDTQHEAAMIGFTPADDPAIVAEYAAKFKEKYEDLGYTVVRLDAELKSATTVKPGCTQQYFAYKNTPLGTRMWNYFKDLIFIDNIRFVDKDTDIGERKLTFTLHDPVYGGEKFSPAIMGNGTQHKYLFYFDNQFPYMHQNLVRIRLGKSYTVNTGVDVFETMTQTQGTLVKSMITFPSGDYEDEVAYDLHSAQYAANTYTSGDPYYALRFTDDYTNLANTKNGMSKMGFSFVIGIIATAMSYLLGIPLGVLLARKKDKLVDKIGTVYVIFIIAVPSLAYIFMFRAIGRALHLPTQFDLDSANKLMYVLPIVSLALPSIGGLMKWVRRYMIDQMNSDYVKFARSGGLSEGEIFSKHILKNAVIPIVHGVPGSVLGALTGAIITESVYVVPGAGGMLVKAINLYDNAAIIGLTLFYSVLSVVSLILGDILMALVDPRISFTEKAR